MKTYKLTITADEKWVEALYKFTQDVHDGEVLIWNKVEEIN